MKLKYTIIYMSLCFFLFLIIIKYGLFVIKITECLTNYVKPDFNSSLYSHNVNLPINEPISCKNFCGPTSKCLLTGEQCTSDIDCYGCYSMSNKNNNKNCTSKNVNPYNLSTFKLGTNLGLQYITLNNDDLKVSYNGLDKWTQTFNEGLNLYNKNRESYDKYSNANAMPIDLQSKMSYYQTNYPTRVSLTGQFYETMPPSSNT